MKTVHFFRKKTAPGFSLIETCMQMMVLTVVTLPMLMTMNMQEMTLLEKRGEIIDQIKVNELFDNVRVQHAAPAEAFTVPLVAGGKNISVFCDPASQSKSPSEFTATCTGQGKDRHRGPFFQRSIKYLPDSSSIQVTVKLFETENPAEKPFLQASREYTVDSYRVATGQSWNADKKDIGGRLFARLIQADAPGNFWYPMALRSVDAPASSSSLRPMYYAVKDPGCNQSQIVHTGALQAPFRSAEYLASGTCLTGVNHRFKVAPNMSYNVNLYFVVPQKPTYNCVSNAKGISCFLADIHISALGENQNSAITLASIPNFDFAAATNLGEMNQGSVLQANVAVPAHTTELQVKVSPAQSVGGQSQVYLSGIEILPQKAAL